MTSKGKNTAAELRQMERDDMRMMMGNNTTRTRVEPVLANHELGMVGDKSPNGSYDIESK